MLKGISRITWERLTLGFFFCALSNLYEIHSGIGSSPWSVFHQGLSRLLGITFGQASILTSLLIIVIVSLMGLKVGLGTILNMLVIGWMIDVIEYFGLITNADTMPQSVMMIVLCMIFNAMGSYFYISCALGCGPRDGLMSSLTEKTHLPVGVIRFLIEGTVLLAGWRLGGLVGIGTVVYVLGIGPIVQCFYKMVDFDIIAVKHKMFGKPGSNPTKIKKFEK